jgi:tRNA (mo5U34)-methyltransferase
MSFNLQAPRIQPRTRTEEEIAALGPWFHNITLPTGEQTAPNHPLGDFPRYKWNVIKDHIPADLSGATALDIGCNAGFYSLELAARGAEVFAIDSDERYLTQARWVAQRWGRSIHYTRRMLWELARRQSDLPRCFDIVLFMGVLYHLRYPLLGLDIAASCTRSTLVFQTLTTADEAIAPVPKDLSFSERDRLSEPGWPRMSFIEHAFASDQTNWWVPNAACCEAMLRAAGLRITARLGHEVYLCSKEKDGQEPPGELAAIFPLV